MLTRLVPLLGYEAAALGKEAALTEKSRGALKENFLSEELKDLLDPKKQARMKD